MPEPTNKKKDSPIHQYAVYTNLAFEMGAVIALGVFGGIKLDKLLNTNPLFTIICSLAGIALSLYLIIRSSLKEQKNKKNGQKNPD
ncbi:MAG: AtpZ/AtpI family protein [Bacteroidales bacterium]|nr:AtpZ/AtpI family protein [Bacteroidales bacterium]